MTLYAPFPAPAPSILAVIIALAVCAPAVGADDWRFSADLYGWFPSVDGQVTFKDGAAGPGGIGSRDLSVDADQILDSLDSVFLGGFQVRKGSWGAFTDLIYMDLGGSKTKQLSALVPGGPGIGVDAELDLKSTIWTLAGQYRFLDHPQLSADAVLGVRYLGIEMSLDLRVDGPLPLELPTAHLSRDPANWDGVVGLRGEFRPGGDWILPYYFDVGTGDSALTWQALVGVGYRFHWGDLVLAYRHLAYEFDDSAKGDLDLAFSGAGLGVAFRF